MIGDVIEIERAKRSTYDTESPTDCSNGDVGSLASRQAEEIETHPRPRPADGSISRRLSFY
jgi:hypothetical protein